MSSDPNQTFLPKFREHQLAHTLLDGLRGLEIGPASHNPFGLQTRNVAPHDDFEFYAEESRRVFGIEPAQIDIWAYAWDIPVPDASEDFVLSSHVVEHLPNPIKTFIEWNRVVRDGGYVFMIVPLKGALAEDASRELTSFTHLLDDFKNGLDLDTHPLDDSQARMGHYHTLVPQTVMDLVAYMRQEGLCNWTLVAREEIDSKVGNGFTLVFQVVHQPQAVSGTPRQSNRNGDRNSPLKAQSTSEEVEQLRTQLEFLRTELRMYEADLAESRKTNAEHENTITQFFDSEAYAMGAAIWRMRARIVPPGSRRERAVTALLGLRRSQKAAAYAQWIAQTEPSPAQLAKQSKSVLSIPYRPLISVLTPVYNTPPELLRKMIDSVVHQTYDNWELCLVDGNSDPGEVPEILREYAGRDPRIRVRMLEKNRGISGNSNEALAMAQGEFIALLDHDDMIAPFALFEVVRLLNSESADFIYSDRDLISEDGTRRHDPFFKPDWSPEILLSANYLAHLTVFRRDLAIRVGGFAERTDGAQDWDLFLRLAECTNRVAHIPKVLYHWRCWSNSTSYSMRAKPYARDVQKRVVHEHLRRCGVEPTVTLRPNLGLRSTWRTSPETKVSIIVSLLPNQNLSSEVRSILAGADDNVEILIVSNAQSRLETAPSQDDRLRALISEGDFNKARLNNFASRHAKGNALLFLSGDLDPIDNTWLREFTQWIEWPGIGIVGGKILDANSVIEHAGLIIDAGGNPCSIFGSKTNALGLFGTTDWYRNFSAVSGDCLMIRRDLFLNIGGFDETKRNADVDLCQRARERQLRIMYTPFAVFKRVDCDNPGNANGLTGDFRARIINDPYYNRNLGFLLT